MPAIEAGRLLRGPIVKGVGQAKKNLALDVALVQSLLNTVKSKPESKTKVYLIAKPIISTKTKAKELLVVNGRYSEKLFNEIKAFQGLYCNFPPDGKISPDRTTWKTLVKVAGVNLNKINKLDTIFGKTTVSHSDVLLKVNKSDLKSYISSHLYLKKAKEDLDNFLNSLFSDTTVTNVYWAAYYLATTYHETEFTFRAVIESDKGKGREYAKAIKVKDVYGYRGKKDVVYDNVFYGRGYVQITWAESYKYISNKIGLRKDELYINPDKTLETATAYKALTYWMQNNIPTVKGAGRKIQEHITSQGKPNYIAARKIVNGTDKAERVANYAIVLEALIRLSARK